MVEIMEFRVRLVRQVVLAAVVAQVNLTGLLVLAAQGIRLPHHQAKVVMAVLVEKLMAHHSFIVLVAVVGLVPLVAMQLQVVLLVAVAQERHHQLLGLQSHTLVAVVDL